MCAVSPESSPGRYDFWRFLIWTFCFLRGIDSLFCSWGCSLTITSARGTGQSSLTQTQARADGCIPGASRRMVGEMAHSKRTRLEGVARTLRRYGSIPGAGRGHGRRRRRPSGIATYSVAGAQTGYGLLWTSLLAAAERRRAGDVRPHRPGHGRRARRGASAALLAAAHAAARRPASRREHREHRRRHRRGCGRYRRC